jgi:hypothetical protein
MPGAGANAGAKTRAKAGLRPQPLRSKIAREGGPFHPCTMKPLRLPIASPCHENWDAMDPTARGRFCHKCEKQVLDLSSMTEREARTTLGACAGKSICVRYHHDDDGAIRFRAEPRIAAAAAGVVLTTLLAACAPHDNPDVRRDAPVVRVDPKPDPDRPVMGEPMPIEPVMMGAIAEVPEPVPEPPQVKGEIVAPDVDEPCDKPPVAPPTHVKMGKIKKID